MLPKGPSGKVKLAPKTKPTSTKEATKEVCDVWCDVLTTLTYKSPRTLSPLPRAPPLPRNPLPRPYPLRPPPRPQPRPPPSLHRSLRPNPLLKPLLQRRFLRVRPRRRPPRKVLLHPSGGLQRLYVDLGAFLRFSLSCYVGGHWHDCSCQGKNCCFKESPREEGRDQEGHRCY